FRLPESVIQPFDRVYALVLGGIGDGLVANNLQIFASFVLAGCTMYLLARDLTGSPLAAALAGLIFTMAPFHLAESLQYRSLLSLQWLPLFVLALLLLFRKWTKRAAALTGAAFTLVVAGSYCYAWFALWFAVALLCVFLAGNRFVALRGG